VARGNVRVSITADADGVRRATKDAERHLHGLNKTGTRALRGLGAAAIGAGIGIAGGVVYELGRSVKAAIEAEQSQARLQAQLVASGISFEAHAKTIDTVIQKHSQLSGLDDEELQDAFTNIVRVTGDVDKSLRLTGLAADFARAKHLDVAKAGEIVAKVAGGNTGILSRYGITMEKGASATEALGVLQQKFAGQAKAYGDTTGGSLDRVKVAAENLEERIGGALAPTVKRAADVFADLAGELGKIADRKDIDLGDKIKLSKQAISRKLGPVVDAIGDKLKGADLGAKLAEGVEKGIPVIARAAAKAAPRAAEAFVKGFADAGTWGRLITLGWLSSKFKLGLFGKMGTLAAGSFSGRFRKKADTDMGEAGKKSGSTFADKAGAALVTGIAGWEIGTWLRDTVPAVRQAGDFIGSELAKAIGGGAEREMGALGEDIGLGILGITGAGPRPLTPPSELRPRRRPRRRRSRRGSRPGARTGGLAGASSAGGDSIQVRTSGESGGSELRSLKRAQAWIRKNFPGVATLLEDAGGPNQHLHVEAGDKNLLRSIARGLERAGFSVGELLGHDPVSPVHSRGGLGGVPGDHYTGNAFDLNADHRDIAPPRGRGGIRGGRGGGGSRGGRDQFGGDTLSTGQLCALALWAGFDRDDAAIAAAIAKAESSGKTGARNVNTNGTTDKGLWQINSVHGFKGNLFDARTNARAAYVVYRKQGFGAWVCYSNGSYKRFLKDAMRAISRGVQGAVPTTGTVAYDPLVAGGPARSFEDRMGQIDADLSLYGDGPDPYGQPMRRGKKLREKRDLIRARIAQIKRRIRKIDQALQKRLRRSTRARLVAERRDLVSELASLGGDLSGVQGDIGGLTLSGPEQTNQAQYEAGLYDEPERPDVPTFTATDFANANLALAELTPGLDDDRAALAALLGIAEGELAAAQASGDPIRIAEAAGNVKQLRDAIASLAEALTDNTAALLALKEQEAERLAQLLAVSQSQYGVLAQAIAHVASGEIGGRYGLGRQSPSAAGTLARY
jgi:hypothetical protein